MSNYRGMCGLLLGVVCLISSCLWAGEAEPPVLPKDVDAMPPELFKRMGDLIKAAERYRGLHSKTNVPCGALGELGLKRKMIQAFQEELPDSKMNVLETSLKALKLIPDSMTLSEYYPKLLTSQVGGYYDPRRKYLTIVLREGGILGKEASKKYGEALAGRMEETVLVHELTHALQDQHFDLQKFAINDPLSDEGAARTALVEGDATLTMYNYFSGMNLEDVPGVEQMMEQMMSDPKKLLDMSADMPGGQEMADAPAWFRDNLLFSYLRGYMFCMAVKRKGGQKLLDYAFEKDPPRSSEQILHPEKWLSKRDDPVVIVWPDLSDLLPGYKKISEAQLGEQSIRVFLNESLKDSDKAAAAASGWGGDRFAVYKKDNNILLLWITEWDSNDDSRKFKDACAALGAGWDIELSRPSRVQIIRGNLSADELAAVKKRLAGAEAKVPENKPIDYAALGIQVKDNEKTANNLDKGGEFDLGKLLNNPEVKKMAEGLLGGDKGKGGGDFDVKKLMNDPNIKKLAEGITDDKGKKLSSDFDLDKLMNDPNLQKMAEGLLGGGGGNKGENGNIAEMMKSPLVQDMVKKMLAQERPKGQITADGRTYTNEKLGFTINVPDTAKGWKLDGKPDIPMASVLISDKDREVQITIVAQGLPIAMPIETMGPMLEMGPKMAMQDFKEFSASNIEIGARKGYELVYEGGVNGQKFHFIQRYFTAGNNMIVLSAMTPVESWDKYEKTIKDVLKTFSFVEVKEGKDEALKEDVEKQPANPAASKRQQK